MTGVDWRVNAFTTVFLGCFLARRCVGAWRLAGLWAGALVRALRAKRVRLGAALAAGTGAVRRGASAAAWCTMVRG